MNGTEALCDIPPSFRYEALVTVSQHLSDAAKVHDGTQGAAAQASLGGLTTAVAVVKGSTSIAQVAAIAPVLAEVKVSVPSPLDAIQSAW